MAEKIIRTEQDQKRATEIYDALRDELQTRDLSNTQSYDKAIITLSATSLGVSLTAIKFIVPIETANYLWLIKAGWVLLLLSIVITLIAFRLSNKALKIQLKNAEDYYIKCEAGARERKNHAEEINNHLNVATGVLFVLAITSIVLFVILNIGLEKGEMSKDKDNSSNQAELRESTNIPQMTEAPEKRTVFIGDSANTPTMTQAPGTLSTAKNSSNVPTMQVAPQAPQAPAEPPKPEQPTNTSDNSEAEFKF